MYSLVDKLETQNKSLNNGRGNELPVLPELPSSPERIEDNVAVWSEMKLLSTKYNCLSLGEGAPGYATPQFLIDFMKEAMDEGFNQYNRTFGTT